MTALNLKMGFSGKNTYRRELRHPALCWGICVLQISAAACLFIAPSTSWSATASSNDRPIPTWDTQRKSRVYDFKIPAPRGIITDREGVPLASSRVGWDICMSPSSPHAPREREHIGGRWLIPLPSEEDVPPERIKTILSANPGYAYSSPRYYREYGLGRMASHIIGYVGRRAPLASGPAENGDLIFTEEEGKDGLELAFDSVLRGSPGRLSVSVDALMRSSHKKVSRPPIPGKNVVTTLSTSLQRSLETTLSSVRTPTTAVMIDPSTGDILAAASFPNFSPADMSPYGQFPLFQSISEDPSAPLLPRHFRAEYPPASSFKTFVALAALCSGAVSPDERLGCPPSLKVGNIVFRNWTSADSGSMDVSKALAVSCNTWFYSAGLKAGAATIIKVASEFGFGTPSGVVFPSSASGLLPDDEYMKSRHGRNILQGDVANISIGQGDLLTSPLQMAMAYAAVANGGVLWRPRLVMQVQDIDNSVIASYPPRARRKIVVPESIRSAIVSGLEMAVKSGTAKSAAVSGLNIAGKTGTAQWGPSRENKRLAWFCGFAPASSPKVAFAFLVEGRPGQPIAGSDAASLAGKVLRLAKAEGFFEIDENTTRSEQVGEPPAPSPSPGGGAEDQVRRALPVPVEPEQTDEKTEESPDAAMRVLQDNSEPDRVLEVYEVPQVDLVPLLEASR